jgi:SAM-dependent methyltransferase
VTSTAPNDSQDTPAGEDAEAAGTPSADGSADGSADAPAAAPGDPADIPTDVIAGQAVYTRRKLALYDIAVLGGVNRWVWRCPTATLRRLYDSHITARHLDVGVGTGYFLDHATWPDPSPSVTLVDLNVDALNAAAARIHRLGPRTARRNILEPTDDLPGAPFSSVGLNYLFHCLPGPIEEKARRVFDGLVGVLAPDAVVFGATILAAGPSTPRRARALLALLNRRGIFHNTRDHPDGLDRALGETFAEHRVERVGAVAVFMARTPRSDPPPAAQNG